MVDTTHNLKIKADASSAKKAGQEIKAAFSPQQLREFNRASKDLGREFEGLVKRQVELNKELGKMKEGSREFKKLAREIRDVDRHAQGLHRTLQQLDKVQQQSQQRSQRAGAGRHGFVAGAASGAGLGAFIPQGPGMYPRMAGMAIGGGIRRAAGAAAAPFSMPGIGGISQALSGIPIIGGAMAGGLQMASGAYQSAVGYDRQLLGMLSYAGAPPTSAQQAAARARSTRQQQAAINTQHDPKIKAARAAFEAAKGAAVAGGALDLTGIGDTATGAKGTMQAAVGGWGGAFMGALTHQDTKDAAKDLGKARAQVALKKTARSLQRASLEKINAQKAVKGKGLSARGLPGLSEGVDYGMGPQQMMGLFGEMMGARGGTYDDVTRQGFREAMAAKTAFGISGGQAGQFSRMGVAGGGGANANLPQILQAAMVQGLRGSQVPEYLSTLVGLGQEAERSGVKIDARGFSRMTAQLGGAGLKGLQAQRVAGGINRAAMGLSEKGVNGPMDMVMLRAAGFDPSQGPEGYAAAIQKLEGGMDQDMLNTLMGDLTEGSAGGGMGPKMQSLMLRRAMGRMGVKIGGGQSSRMLEAYKLGRPPSVESIVSAGERPGAGGRLIRTAKDLVGREAGSTVGAAGLEAGRIGLGRRSQWVLKFEQNAMKTGGIMANFGKDFNKLNGVIKSMLTTADTWTKGGLEGILTKLRDLIVKGAMDSILS